MYHPEPQPSPPASPASSVYPPRPSPHAPPPSTAPLWAAFSRANDDGRRRRSDDASSIASSGADSTGALVGLGLRQQQQRQRSQQPSPVGDDMVEILLPNSPPPAPPAQVGSSSSSSGAGYPSYPPPSHQSLGSSASLVPSSFAGSEDAYVDDDPTPVPGQPSAFGPNLSQHALYARERADEQATYASYTPSHQHSRSGLSWAAAGGGGYAPSLAGSLGGRSVFDREGGWAQGGAALSRSTSRTSSYAGSELAEKFDYTAWDLSNPLVSSSGRPGSSSAEPEPDDWLHDPTLTAHSRGSIFTLRGLLNLGTLFILGLLLFMLFAGYPIVQELRSRRPSTLGAFNLGGTNGSGQVPELIGNFGLIDQDTPQSAHTIVSDEGPTWELVFSDEFETEGRSFYPGDDPYWEATDLHAWATNDLEWYDPQQSTTKNGRLVQTLDKRPSHGLDYAGASLQSWNKFCFQGGRLEARIRLPGSPTVMGLWPAFWTMGNLGRVGYGGTLEGTWPYSYDSCDVGTLANQTLNGLPTVNAKTGLAAASDYALSYLPGQRLSACTCPDDATHPGPKRSDGTFVGRSAPEIDVIEAQVANGEGEVSLSAQWAPFNPYYEWDNATYMDIVDDKKAYLNTYKGGPTQMTTSVVGITNQNCYQFPANGSAEGCFATYAFEYKMGSDGYIKWFNDGELSWTFRNGGLGPIAAAQISNRPIPVEPMYILFNLAISENFGAIDYDGLEPMFPMKMEVEYVRVYQDPNDVRIGCDPEDAPTAKYIERYIHGYNNPNITTWDQLTDNAPLPLNRLIDTC